LTTVYNDSFYSYQETLYLHDCDLVSNSSVLKAIKVTAACRYRCTDTWTHDS